MTLPNPETLLADISAQIKTQIDSHGAANCALVGIHSGGVWLMDRILKSLKLEIGLDITNGTLDAAMYRDDYNQRGLKSEPKPARTKSRWCHSRFKGIGRSSMSNGKFGGSL